MWRWGVSVGTTFAALAMALGAQAAADEVHEGLETDDPKAGAAVLERFEADPDAVDVRAQDDLQRTYLHLAARYGHDDVVRWLVAHGADPNAVAYNGFTPINLAARFDRVDTIDLLVELGADPAQMDTTGHTPLAAALSVDRTAAAERLRAHGVEVDMRSAIYLGDGDRVAELGASDPAAATIQLLALAAAEGHLSVVDALVEAGAPVNPGGDEWVWGTPLLSAAASGHVDVAARLIEAGADLERQVFVKPLGTLTPLMYAAWADHAPMVELLLEAGAQADATNDDGKDALSYASMNESSEAAAILEGAASKEK